MLRKTVDLIAVMRAKGELARRDLTFRLLESATLGRGIAQSPGGTHASRDQAGQTIVADAPDDLKHQDEPVHEVLDRKTERRLVRRIDLILMPLLTIAYGLQFLDKAVLGSASVFGIIPDLGLCASPELDRADTRSDHDQRRRVDYALQHRQRRLLLGLRACAVAWQR